MQSKIPGHFPDFSRIPTHATLTDPNSKPWQHLQKQLRNENLMQPATKLISFCILSIVNILTINTGEYVLFL